MLSVVASIHCMKLTACSLKVVQRFLFLTGQFSFN